MPLSISKREAGALVEMARRRTTSIELFRAQSQQNKIFESAARELLVRGGVRSGKSTSLGVLVGAIATDGHITLSDGRKVRARRPHQIGKPLTIWIVGYDQRHIGETIYRILFKPGLFKIIRDLETGQWRTFQQDDPSDAARANEVMPSFPVIPNRFIKPKSWDWENAGNKEFKKVTIWDPITQETLADIYAYSSKAEPKQGDPVDVIWIDEAIKYPGHYSEWQSRLADRRGRLFWSSWPRANNSALRALTNRAKEEDPNNPCPMTQEVILRTSENAQLDPDGKRELLAGFTPDELASRDRGEYSLDQLKMYSLFDKSYHCASYPEEVDDKISKILRQSMWNPPADWTRELILDPGTNHPAVLFCAIPPPQYGEYYVVFDELYPGRADADTLAPMIKAKMKGYPFYRFIIDQRAGKQTTMGFSLSVADNYSRAFKESNIASQITGNHFVWGSANVEARIMRLQSWMHVNNKDGSYPYLRVITDKCPNLCKQLEDYVKEDSENQNTIGDRPAKGQNIDLAVSLEYWAASFPKWIPVARNNIGGGSPAYRLFQHLKSQEAARTKPKDESVVLGTSLTPYRV